MKKPVSVFRETIKRSLDLIEASKNVQDTGVADDMVRSAIVLSVAGFDAYFTDKFTDILVPYLKKKKPGASLIKLLEEAGLGASEALQIATMKRPFRRIRTIVQKHLATQTTQRFNAIDELFISIGIKDLCKHAERKTGYKQLNARVEALILKRHIIAHRADLNFHSKPNKNDSAKIKRRIEGLQKLVIACDQIIDSAAIK